MVVLMRIISVIYISKRKNIISGYCNKEEDDNLACCKISLIRARILLYGERQFGKATDTKWSIPTGYCNLSLEKDDDQACCEISLVRARILSSSGSNQTFFNRGAMQFIQFIQFKCCI